MLPISSVLWNGKTRQQVEDELLEEVQARHSEFTSAINGDRVAARARFTAALEKFNRFILCGKLPDENGRYSSDR